MSSRSTPRERADQVREALDWAALTVDDKDVTLVRDAYTLLPPGSIILTTDERRTIADALRAETMAMTPNVREALALLGGDQ